VNEEQEMKEGRQSMKRQFGIWRMIFLLALLVVANVGAGAAQDDPAHSVPVWFGMEIFIAPDPDGEGLWNCEAVLKDLASGEALSAPSIVFAAGEKASVQSGLASDMIWELEVEVSGNADEATWSSRVTMGDQVLSVGTGSIRFAAE